MRVGQRPLQLYPELAVSAKSYNSRALDPTHKGIGISANPLKADGSKVPKILKSS